MNTIYSARCIKCGQMQDRLGQKIADGERLQHASSCTNDQGLTEQRECPGVFISVMCRTREEIYAISDRYRGE